MPSSISASSSRQAIRDGLTTRARRAMAMMALGAVLALLAYAGLVVLQMGSWAGAEWWLRDITELRRMLYKERLAALPPDQPKVVMFAGSASLFGANTPVIAEESGLPFLNFGQHAGLDIDLIALSASDFIQAGDKVVAPFEFELYARDKPSELTPANFLAIYYRYAAPLPLARDIEILKATSPFRIFEGLKDALRYRLSGARSYPVREGEALRQAWHEESADPEAAPQWPYSISSVSPDGDLIVPENTPASRLAGLSKLTTPNSASISPFALRQLTGWQRFIDARGAHLYMTWPVIVEDDHGTIFKPEYWQTLIDLARRADAEGFPIHCDPIPLIVPRQYRYDTVYHVNVKGQFLYSKALGACIRNIAEEPFDFAHADPEELAKRARERVDSLRQPVAPFLLPYERNLDRLATLAATLAADKAANGAFPAELSSGSEPPGLWYRSDGRDYKLLIEDPEECYTVAMAMPERADTVRNKDGRCAAYGYWSAGAKDW
ncbi:MAG: hypothetical protein J0H11_12450 [Rhizobiales bacterium]|nr:hypothetical protein [Hyphomicrobiales bacterium]